eukprot:PITA_24807
MKEEMDSLVHNQTWDLIRFLADKPILHNKWVYRLKEDGGRKRYKARLVVKGFAQKKGIEFDEIFSPVVKMNSIKTILSLVVAEDLHLEYLDVKTTFLHGDLEEEIYMQKPQGYEVKGKEELVCRLKKSLYGLEQVPRQWYLKLTEVGSLMYAMVCIRLDIANVVGVVSRYMKNLGKEHYMVMKWILRYLRGITNEALCFDGSNTALEGYVDVDMVDDRDNKRTTTGYVFTIGATIVSWVSKLQIVVALSTTKAEYVAVI